MNRNEAREYFKNLGLTYTNLTKDDIKALHNILSEELLSYLSYGDLRAQLMNMKVSELRTQDVNVLKSGLKSARIQIDGSYFDRREGITFSQTGFIGLGAEFSDVNVQPILKAFVKWCDYIIDKPNVA